MAGPGSFPKSAGTDTIYLSDFNSLQSLVSSVKQDFYGVPTTSSQVPDQTKIRASQWNALKKDLDDCTKHQTGSLTPTTTKVKGNLIRATGTNEYSSYVTSVVNNKLLPNQDALVYAPTQLALVANTSVSNRNGAVSPWSGVIRHQVRVDFATDNDALYFFNCGGYFATNIASTGGSNSQKDIDWRNVIREAGTRVYDRAVWISQAIGDTYTIPIDKTAKVPWPAQPPYFNSFYHKVTPAYVASGMYRLSFYRVRVTKVSASSLVFSIILNDIRPGNAAYSGLVTLDITSSLSYYKSVDAIVSPTPAVITTVTNF